jgi:membrane dipeptidase
MILDAKLIPVWERSVFQSLNARGITAVSIVCSIWEGPQDSWKKLETLKKFVAANHDILYPVDNIADIDNAAHQGKTGIIFSWQNSSGFGDDLASVAKFAAAGLRIAQPTFIARNSAGSGCNEAEDYGITDYGRRLVCALNEAGIAIDLAHVGTQTARDVAHSSTQPVFYSQSSPRALNDSARNKSDEDMRMVAESGGVVCLTTLRQYLPRGTESTVQDMAETIRYAMRVVGEDSVALGSDLTPGQPPQFFDYISHDGGSGRRLMNYSQPPTLPGFEDFDGYERLQRALATSGVGGAAIDKFMGSNLRRYFASVWKVTPSAPADDE